MKRSRACALIACAFAAGCATAATSESDVRDLSAGIGPGDLSLAGQSCIGKDLQVDPANCGTCHHSCVGPNVAEGACHAGHCAIGQCDPGFLDVNGVVDDGCECQPEATESPDSSQCSSAIEAGDIFDTPGAKLEIVGNLVPAGDEDWYFVRARDDKDPDGTCNKYDLKIVFAANPDDAARFDVFDDCKKPTNCGGEGEQPSSLTEYEWNSNGALPAEACPCYADAVPPDAGHLCTDSSQLLRIRVFRAAGKPYGCGSYKLLVTNGA